jgi:hypothetical protein
VPEAWRGSLELSIASDDAGLTSGLQPSGVRPSASRTELRVSSLLCTSGFFRMAKLAVVLLLAAAAAVAADVADGFPKATKAVPGEVVRVADAAVTPAVSLRHLLTLSPDTGNICYTSGACPLGMPLLIITRPGLRAVGLRGAGGAPCGAPLARCVALRHAPLFAP